MPLLTTQFADGLKQNQNDDQHMLNQSEIITIMHLWKVKYNSFNTTLHYDEGSR